MPLPVIITIAVITVLMFGVIGILIGEWAVRNQKNDKVKRY